MKKSQLKRIIKEEIKRLQKQPLQEQNPINSPQQLLNHFLNNVHNYRLHCKAQWDLESWALSIFSLPVFTSTNPNQPCQFICNKIQHFTNLLAQAGPNSISAGMWRCKLKFFQALHQFYNCYSQC